MFRDWFAAHDLAFVLERFEAEEGTIAPIYSAEQIVQDRHVRARGFLQEVDDEHFGRVRVPGVVPRFGNHPCTIQRTARGIGSDNAEVLGRCLGLDAAAIERLQREGKMDTAQGMQALALCGGALLASFGWNTLRFYWVMKPEQRRLESLLGEYE